MTECGNCTLCCKLLSVRSLNKPRDAWCPHCIATEGCAIYDARPQDCRDFKCYWLLHDDAPPELRPDRTHLVVADVSEPLRAFIVHVDPAYPHAYREGTGKRMLERLTKRQPKYRNVLLLIGDQKKLLTTDSDLARRFA